ncbi:MULTISPECIES: hypothetical protein [unclassified Streptomyces]|uniref:hypothetical protein n=1 Tax=unclassified Streptomyces TaxID=2593676 RepID=UPI0035DB7E41
MTQLTVSVDEGLVAEVTKSADQHGLPVDEYVAAVLRAAQTPGVAREELARELARGSYQTWDTAGRPEDGAMSMEEVFGP